MGGWQMFGYVWLFSFLCSNDNRFLELGDWAGKYGWMGWKLRSSHTFSRFISLLSRFWFYLPMVAVSSSLFNLYPSLALFFFKLRFSTFIILLLIYELLSENLAFPVIIISMHVVLFGNAIANFFMKIYSVILYLLWLLILNMLCMVKLVVDVLNFWIIPFIHFLYSL